MMAEFKFEKLTIWNKAMEFGEEINSMTNKFPESEGYNLTSQIRRAADSIALNISEGSIGQSNPEFRKFMGYSIRSLAEVVTCLHKAKLRDYISKDEFESNYEFAFNLMNMMWAFRNRLKLDTLRGRSNQTSDFQKLRQCISSFENDDCILK